MSALRPLSLGEVLDRGVVVFWQTLPRAFWLVAPAAAVCALVLTKLAAMQDASNAETAVPLPAFAASVALFASACPLVVLYGRAATGEPCSVKTALRSPRRQRRLPPSASSVRRVDLNR